MHITSMVLSTKSVNSSSFSYSIFTTPEQSIEMHKKTKKCHKRVKCKYIKHTLIYSTQVTRESLADDFKHDFKRISDQSSRHHSLTGMHATLVNHHAE